MTAAIIIGAIVGAIVFAALFAKDPREECPKLMLGYHRCNNWREGGCDHSPEAFAHARPIFEGQKLAEREFWKEYK